MSKELKLGRDRDGNVTFGIDIIGSRKYTYTVLNGDTLAIPISAKDATAIITGTPGMTTRSSFQPFSTIPATPGGGATVPAVESNEVIGLAVIELGCSHGPSANSDTLYIGSLSVDPIELTVSIYEKRTR
jgi:hypothetical protein